MSKSRPIDLLAAIPVGALCACFAFFAVGLLISARPFEVVPDDGKLVLVFFAFIFLPVSFVASVPTYFLLRRFKALGLVGCGLAGFFAGLTVALLLPAKDITSGILLCLTGTVGGLGGWGTLVCAAVRRVVQPK